MREQVKWFAEKMEHTLKRNDRKGGWNDCQWEYLVDRLLGEFHELRASLEAGDNPEDIIHEAADVANFAMMIADNARRLMNTV